MIGMGLLAGAWGAPNGQEPKENKPLMWHSLRARYMMQHLNIQGHVAASHKRLTDLVGPHENLQKTCGDLLAQHKKMLQLENEALAHGPENMPGPQGAGAPRIRPDEDAEERGRVPVEIELENCRQRLNQLRLELQAQGPEGLMDKVDLYLALKAQDRAMGYAISKGDRR
ncbi:MAG: hypothetical protein ACK5PQ_05070 [Alphaproteobacteria bacterium]